MRNKSESKNPAGFDSESKKAHQQVTRATRQGELVPVEPSHSCSVPGVEMHTAKQGIESTKRRSLRSTAESPSAAFDAPLMDSRIAAPASSTRNRRGSSSSVSTTASGASSTAGPSAGNIPPARRAEPSPLPAIESHPSPHSEALPPHWFPPNRGFEYKVGQRLEAQELSIGRKWFAARIVVVDPSDGTLKVHYDYWSSRFDEWIDARSDRLRPLSLKGAEPVSKRDERFKVGEFVFAKWGSQPNYFPGKVLERLNRGDRYHVLYYDGFSRYVSKKVMKKMTKEEEAEVDKESFGKLTLLPQYPDALFDPNINKRVSDHRRRKSDTKDGQVEDGGTTGEPDVLKMGALTIPLNVLQSRDALVPLPKRAEKQGTPRSRITPKGLAVKPGKPIPMTPDKDSMAKGDPSDSVPNATMTTPAASQSTSSTRPSMEKLVPAIPAPRRTDVRPPSLGSDPPHSLPAKTAKVVSKEGQRERRESFKDAPGPGVTSSTTPMPTAPSVRSPTYEISRRSSTPRMDGLPDKQSAGVDAAAAVTEGLRTSVARSARLAHQSPDALSPKAPTAERPGPRTAGLKLSTTATTGVEPARPGTVKPALAIVNRTRVAKGRPKVTSTAVTDAIRARREQSQRASPRMEPDPKSIPSDSVMKSRAASAGAVSETAAPAMGSESQTSPRTPGSPGSPAPQTPGGMVTRLSAAGAQTAIATTMDKESVVPSEPPDVAPTSPKESQAAAAASSSGKLQLKQRLQQRLKMQKFLTSTQKWQQKKVLLSRVRLNATTATTATSTSAMSMEPAAPAKSITYDDRSEISSDSKLSRRPVVRLSTLTASQQQYVLRRGRGSSSSSASTSPVKSSPPTPVRFVRDSPISPAWPKLRSAMVTAGAEHAKLPATPSADDVSAMRKRKRSGSGNPPSKKAALDLPKTPAIVGSSSSARSSPSNSPAGLSGRIIPIVDVELDYLPSPVSAAAAATGAPAHSSPESGPAGDMPSAISLSVETWMPDVTFGAISPRMTPVPRNLLVEGPATSTGRIESRRELVAPGKGNRHDILDDKIRPPPPDTHGHYLLNGNKEKMLRLQHLWRPLRRKTRGRPPSVPGPGSPAVADEAKIRVTRRLLAQAHRRSGPPAATAAKRAVSKSPGKGGIGSLPSPKRGRPAKKRLIATPPQSVDAFSAIEVIDEVSPDKSDKSSEASVVVLPEERALPDSFSAIDVLERNELDAGGVLDGSEADSQAEIIMVDPRGAGDGVVPSFSSVAAPLHSFITTPSQGQHIGLIPRQTLAASSSQQLPEVRRTIIYPPVPGPVPCLPQAIPLGQMQPAQGAVPPSSSSSPAHQFNPQLLAKRKWLRYENGVAYCAWCRDRYMHHPRLKNHVMIEGISSLFSAVVTSHDNAGIHFRAAQARKESLGLGSPGDQTHPQPSLLTAPFQLEAGSKPSRVFASRTSPRSPLRSPTTRGDQRPFRLSAARRGRRSASSESEVIKTLLSEYSAGREDWLVYEDGKLYCKVCRLFPVATFKTPWTHSGLDVRHVKKCIEHEMKSYHVKAFNRYLTEVLNIRPAAGPIGSDAPEYIMPAKLYPCSHPNCKRTFRNQAQLDKHLKYFTHPIDQSIPAVDLMTSLPPVPVDHDDQNDVIQRTQDVLLPAMDHIVTPVSVASPEPQPAVSPKPPVPMITISDEEESLPLSQVQPRLGRKRARTALDDALLSVQESETADEVTQVNSGDSSSGREAAPSRPTLPPQAIVESASASRIPSAISTASPMTPVRIAIDKESKTAVVATAERSSAAAGSRAEPREGSDVTSSSSSSESSSSSSSDSEDEEESLEIVRCICESSDEEGFMMQCEQCSTWQHGDCFKMDDDDDVPTRYVCYLCKNPPGIRGNHKGRWPSLKSWQESGALPCFKLPLDSSPTGAAAGGGGVRRVTAKAQTTTKLIAETNHRVQETVDISLAIRALQIRLTEVESDTAGKDDIEIAQEKARIEVVFDGLERRIDELTSITSGLEKKWMSVNGSPPRMNVVKTMCELQRDLRRLGRAAYYTVS